MDIIRNAIQTPDGTVLESRNRHDFRSHVDANGKSYFVDGGHAYLRRSANGDEIDMSVTLQDSHEAVRNNLLWGTRGPDGSQPMTLVLLKEMETDHIEACLNNIPYMLDQYRIAMVNELRHRGIEWTSTT